MNFMYVCACVYTHTDLKLKFEVFYVTKLHVAHEEYRTGGLRINIQHLVIFNVCQILNTWAFLFLTYIKKYKKNITVKTEFCFSGTAAQQVVVELLQQKPLFGEPDVVSHRLMRRYVQLKQAKYVLTHI